MKNASIVDPSGRLLAALFEIRTRFQDLRESVWQAEQTPAKVSFDIRRFERSDSHDQTDSDGRWIEVSACFSITRSNRILEGCCGVEIGPGGWRAIANLLDDDQSSDSRTFSTFAGESVAVDFESALGDLATLQRDLIATMRERLRGSQSPTRATRSSVRRRSRR